MDANLKRPLKLYDRTTNLEDHLSRFLSMANSGEWPMPVWCRMFQQTLDGSARGWFKNLLGGSIDGWVELRQQFITRAGYGVNRRRNEERNAFNSRDGLVAYHPQAPYKAPGADHQGYHHPMVNLNSLTKKPNKIIALELQLNLQPPRPMQLPPKKENQDRYYDYHGEKGPYTNKCFQLRRQLEMAQESGKLNHLIKGVRQRGRGNTKGRDARKDKVINMIRSWPDDRKRKSVQREESWIKAPIVFHPLSMEDASDEPLIIEAVMERYLVRRVYVDQGASMEVMFEHCFENLSPAMKSRLRSTQMDFVGFVGSMVKPLGKIELEVVFSDGGTSRHDKYTNREHSQCQPLNRACCIKKKGLGVRQDPGGDQGSRGIGEGRNSSTGEIPYMDIKPGASG
ncbi:hypothetical protein Tco_0456277 [Tanacetum coccineum]